MADLIIQSGRGLGDEPDGDIVFRTGEREVLRLHAGDVDAVALRKWIRSAVERREPHAVVIESGYPRDPRVRPSDSHGEDRDAVRF